MPIVLIDEPVHSDIEHLFPLDWRVVYMTDNPGPEILATVEAMFVYTHPLVDGALLHQMPNLKIVANFGVGTPHINKSDCRVRGVPVTNTPGVLHHATADLTCGLILAITRNIVAGHTHATGPNFKHYDPHLFWGLELKGSTLGIIGMGEIGTEIARRMHHGFGMNILYHNRTRLVVPEVEAQYVARDDLIARSDVVVLMTPLTEETVGMIGVRELTLMKPTAYLVNTSRGGVLDHDALVKTLVEHKLAGAALDVTEPEPLPRDHPLLYMSNVVITPHIGSATLATRVTMGRVTVANIQAVLGGGQPINPVD